MLVNYSSEGGARGDHSPDSGARDNLNLTRERKLGWSGIPSEPLLLILRSRFHMSMLIRSCWSPEPMLCRVQWRAGSFTITCSTKGVR